METFDLEDEIVKLAGLPNGNHKPRRVASIEGQHFYGQPIGSIIMPDVVDKKISDAAKIGITPPKGALSGGGDHESGSGSSGGSSAVLAPAKPKIKIAKSTISGNKHFSVGNAQYSAPAGSKLIHSVHTPGIAYVVTPDSKVHVFNEAGEAQLDTATSKALANKFLSGNLGDAYEQVDFDSTSASYSIDQLKTGSKLTDQRGNVQFEKTGDDEWTQPLLGAKLTTEDLQPMYDSGELIPEATPEHDAQQQAFETGNKKNFADMDKSEFVDALAAYPEGQQLNFGPDSATVTKTGDDVWELDDGHTTVSSGDLYYSKGTIDTGESEHTDEPSSAPEASAPASPEPPEPAVKKEPRHKAEDTPANAAVSFEQSDLEAAGPGTKIDIDIPGDDTFVLEMNDDHEWVDVTYPANKYTNEDVAADIAEGNVYFSKSKRSLTKDTAKAKPKVEEPKTPEPKLPEDPTELPNGVPLGAVRASEDDLKAAPVGTHMWIYHEGYSGASGEFHKTEQGWNGYGVPIPDSVMYDGNEKNTFYAAYPEGVHAEPAVSEDVTGDQPGQNPSKEWISAAPVGSQLVYDDPKGPGSWDKQSNGEWLNNHSGNVFDNEDMYDLIYDHGNTDIVIGQEAKTTELPPSPDISVQPDGSHSVGDTISGVDDLNQLEAGTKLDYLLPDGSMASYAKLNSGDWLTPNGKVLPSTKLKTTANSGKMTVASLPEKAIDTPTDGITFDNSGKSFTEHDVQEALDSLKNHSSFQIAYGLKAVPDNPIAKVGSDDLKLWAANAYPDLKPKAGLIQLFEDKLGGKPEVPEAAPDKSAEPQISIGALTGKKGTNGAVGGTYALSDVQEAVDILEGFDGKVFKNALTQKNNPLAELSPNDIVGFDKDKLVTKQKFIDLLKKKISEADLPKVENPDIDYDKFTKLGPGSTLIFHGIVGDKTYTKQDDGIWITDGTSSALTDQNWQPSIAKGKVEITKAVPAKKSVGDLLADVAAEQFEASQKSKTEWAAKLNEIYDIKTQTPPGGEYSVNSVNELDALAPGTKIFATDSEGDQDYYTAAGDGVWSDDSFNDKFTSSYFTEPLSQDNVFVYGVPVDKSEADLPELTPEWLSTAPLGSEVTYTNANGKSTVYHKVSDETWATANDPGVTIKEDIISKVSSNPKTSHMLTVNKVGDGTSKANSDHIISNSEADGLPTGTKIRNTLNGDIYERSSDTEWKRTEGSGPETISHDHVRQGAVNKAWALDSKPENKTDTTPNTPDEPNTPEEESTPQEDVTSAPATEADVTSAKPGDFFVSSSGGLAYVKQNNGTWNVYDVQSGQVQPKLYSDDSLKVLVSNGHTNKLEPSEPNDSGLVPGKYWTGGGKAYMIVKPDGTGIYVNSKNVASNLTVAKVKSNHKAGMNVYGGQVKDLPEVPKKQPAVKKFKSVSTIDDGTYYNGDPSDNKTWSYEVHGDTTTVIKPKVDSNYKIGSKPTKEWMAQASAGASFEYKYDVNSVYTKSADGKWLDKDGDEASENIIDNATYYYSYYKVKSNGKSAPVEMPTKKVNTAFETGKLLDEWGNSVVPDDYTGLVSFFGAKSQISDLAKIDELIDDMPAEINFDTYLKNHGVMFLGSKVKAYAAAEGLESNLDSWEKVLKEKAKEMLAGLDTTPPESHAADLFTWNGMGEANYPTNLAGVGQSAYNVSDYNNAIKAISANFGNGKIIGQHYTKMDIYGKKAWVKAFNDGDFAKMYMLEDEAAKKTNSAHVSGIQHPGNPANEGTNHIVWTAAVPGEVSALKTVEGDWSSFNTEASIDEINNYLIKAQMQNPTYLSNSERRIWVNYHRHQNKQLTDQLSLVALNRKKSGDTPLSDPVEWTDNVQPAKIYDTLFENAEFPQSWPQSKAEAYYDDNLDAIPELKSLYDTSESEHPYSGEYLWKTQAVTNYFQQKQEEADAKALIPVYTLKPNQTVKQGTHPHYQFTDQWGGEYGFKFVNPSGNTKLDRYRAEAEHHALLLARTFGYNGAQSHTIDLDTPLGKKYGILQKWHDATGDLMGADWSTMTPTIVGDVASEHVLDWLLDNDDTKGDNMLITPAGRAVGIDKGRAFKHYGAWNGLSGDSSMDSNAQTVYRKMFDAIRSGKIDKETADKAYFQMQKRIKLIQAQSEDVVKGLIADGMKNRDHFDIDYKIDGKKVPANLVGLQNAFLDRRAKLNTDFDNLWAKVYKDAGYGELPEKPVNPLGDSVHSGIDSPDLHEEIFETNSHGKSTQLAGADFIGGTMTMWRADQNGSKSVHAQAYLPPKKQEELLGWLQARSKDVDPDKSDPTGFGSHDVYGDAFIGAAKTINHHITKGDTDYNQTKISEFEKAADLLQKDLDAWEPSLTSNVPDGESYVFPSGQKIPMQQVDQYKLLLDHYYPSIENINSSKVAGDKITHLVNYAPISLDFPIKQYVNGDGEKYTKLADGTWLHNDGTTVKIVPSTNFTDEIEKGEHGFSALQEAKAEREKKNSIKVFYGKTHDLKGSIDSDGTLVYSGTKLSNGVAGSEYEVQLPTGEKIYFRNSSSTGTLTSQAGKLSIYIPNVKDQNESQASMQRVQAVLTEMGLHTDGADEDDAELSYWREMMTILTSRKHVPGSAYAKALADLEKKQQEVGGDPKQFIESMDDKYSVTEQNQFWRSLWGKYFGDDKVENLIATQGYLPKYEKSDLSNPEMGTGKPYWERFDVDTEEIAKQGKVLASAIGGSQSLLVDIVKSGSALSTEERIRYYGRFIGGMSSETDQSYGSGHNVYTRIVSKPSSNQSLIYHPKVFKRTRTYSFRTDMYGKPHVRKDYAPSNPLDAVKGFGHNWGGSLESNNETNIPDSASLFDSLEMIIFDDNEKLAEAIKVLKEKGIEKIRGLPIEDRLIMRAQYNEKIAKVKATWAQ